MGEGLAGAGLGVKVIFNWELLHANERKRPRTKGKRHRLGNPAPWRGESTVSLRHTMIHTGWEAEACWRMLSARHSILTSLALLMSQELPCSDFPALPPPQHRRPKLAQSSCQAAGQHLSGLCVAEATNTLHMQIKGRQLSCRLCQLYKRPPRVRPITWCKTSTWAIGIWGVQSIILWGLCGPLAARL